MVNEYTITNCLNNEQMDQLINLIRQMWWGADRTKEQSEIILKHCIPFAVIEKSSQRLVGFARVLTDEVRYAYIYDVMVEEPLRSQGIGKMIMQAILSHPTIAKVKYVELTCAPDMVEYYKKFGFSDDFVNVVAMRLLN